MKYIIIIPAYNEEKAIKTVVKESLNHSDVLVVDDGSTDGTTELAKNAGAQVIKHEKNMGKGAAIKTGLKYALDNGYKAMILLDGDGQHDPRFIPILVNEIKDAGMIICSRFMQGPPSGMAIQRKFSNYLTTSILRSITGYPITDSQCGFRMISDYAALMFLDLPQDGYEYDSEILYQAYLHNFPVKEMPIPSSYKGEKSYITGIK
ncbi:MAG: glycosyltransferase family 2 protein, partial [Methanobacterium sp.]|nr:glycosyltransferase family 2 protein [Methanobacterium sp.]